MASITASNFARYNEDTIWALDPDSVLTIDFVDVSLVCDVRRLQICWYLWWPCRDFNYDQISSRHYFHNKPFDTKTALSIVNQVWWDAFDYNDKNINPEVGAMRIKQSVNGLYNATADKLGAHVGSLDVLDLYHVINHPRIKAVTDHLQNLDLNSPTVIAALDQSIALAYREVTEILHTEPTLRKNRLVCAVRAGVGDMNQVLQIVCCRGKPTDMDSTIFPRGVMRGLAHGLYSVYETMVESRTAAKSLALQKVPLQQTEYFNRQMQLICGSLMYLDAYWQRNSVGPYHRVDCGTKRTLDWQVTKSSLDDLAGSYHVLETGELELITSDAHHLVGRTVHLRNPLVCGHKDHGTICATCFGQLEFSIPAQSNVGHFAAVAICAIMSQKVLSVKHSEATASAEISAIPMEYRNYIQMSEYEGSIGFAFSLDTDNTFISVSREDCKRLNDVYEAKEIINLNTGNVATMAGVTFHVVDEDLGELAEYVLVGAGLTKSSFSYEFLTHIKKVGFTLTDTEAQISLKGWDLREPVWLLTRKHSNMMDLLKRVRQTVKVNHGDDKKERLNMDLSDTDNPSRALADFYDVIKPRFDFNIALLGVIMRSTLIKSKENEDYRLPQGDEVGEFAEFTKTMSNRSMGSAVPFEGHQALYTSVSSFLQTNRAASPADEILQPTNMFMP